MGWVTLTLRKKELQRSHADYQMQDLQISRTQRQMARQYNYEQTLVQNDKLNAGSDLRNTYKEEQSSIYDMISDQRKIKNSSTASDAEKQAAQDKIDDLNQQLRDAQEQYEYDKNQSDTMYEEELGMIEEEANDIETMYENEKVQIEAQMEAVAAELQAVKEAVSQEIQNNTIALK